VTSRCQRWLGALLCAVLLIPSTARAADDPLRALQWNLDMVGATQAWPVTTGAGVLVAVIDTGVDAAHPDLAGNVIAGPDLVDGDASPDDENGHGTHVIGIIAAHAGNGIGIAGAAPGVRVLAIRALDADGRGDLGAVARGVDAAVAAGARVINLSLTAGPTAPEMLVPGNALADAIQRAIDAGVVVVAAAGNDALPICEQPQLGPGLVCVAAVDRQAQRSGYSNYGIRVDLVAPGGDDADGIISTFPGGDYAEMQGTSQATPMVSAEAALLLSLGLPAPQVIDRIEATTRDLGDPGVDLTYGHGLIDIAAAVGGLRPPAVPRTAPSTSISLWAHAPARVRIGTLLRRGLAVRCRISVAAPCSVRLTTAHGATLARATRALRAGVTSIVRARAIRVARGRLRRARKIRATVIATTPGATPIRRRVLLKR
jgi:subtilisin family serine protease